MQQNDEESYCLPFSWFPRFMAGAALLTCTASADAADQKRRDAPSIVLPHQQADFVRHIAIDLGGSLIKLVYFSPEDALGESGDANEKGRNHSGGESYAPVLHTHCIAHISWGVLPMISNIAASPKLRQGTYNGHRQVRLQGLIRDAWDS